MTLKNLYDRLDFGTLDIPEKSKTALLDLALYLKACNRCEWKGVRDPDGEEYMMCPLCHGEVTTDAEGQKIFRDQLGPVWDQVLKVLEKENLIV